MERTVILTNTALDHYYGTETWTYAMAKELSKNYKVKVFTFTKGKMSEKIEEFAEVVTEMPQGDIYIVNHINCYGKVPQNKPIIFTSHGRSGLEQFPADGCLQVGVTEETAKGREVIRNGIDCKRFYETPINKELKTVLYLSHPDYGRAKEIIREACQGLELITIEEETFKIENLIHKSDLVITLGRGILESLSCGRNVISADWRDGWMDGLKGGGMITEDNFDFLKTHAFSGRNAPIEFTAERLREEFKKYDSEMNLRHKIQEEFNIKTQCEKYLTYFKKDI